MVAPYSFMTTCVLMMRASLIYVRTNENVGFPLFYDISILEKAKLTVDFLVFPSVNVLKLCRF